MGDLDEAYILHTHGFSDSKLIAEFFTRTSGRVKTVARNPSKKAGYRFQPFRPLCIALKGQRELKTLLHCEALAVQGPCSSLRGESLFCALYVNELMQRLTPLDEPDPSLFNLYETVLTQLSHADVSVLREVALRNFELELLKALGYQINFFEQSSGEAITPADLYQFDAYSGFTSVAQDAQNAISGRTVLAVGQGDFSTAQALKAAKRVVRAALQPHLGHRPLKSRDLFR